MKLHSNDIKKLFYVTVLLFAIGLAAGHYSYTGGEFDIAVKKTTEELPIVPLEEAFPFVLEANTSLFTSLREREIAPALIHEIVNASKPVQDLSRLRPGIRYQLYFKNDQVKDIPKNQEVVDLHPQEAQKETLELTSIHFRFSAIESLVVSKIRETWKAEKIIEPVDIKTMTYTGTVTSSLWESAERAKMDPNLISELADIFAWEVDFAREVQLHDKWRLTVEQKLVKGQPIGWGAILAAEYINSGESHRAALFRVNGEEVGYFTPEGGSLRKMFLKSPLRYGRITSGFGRRFHPILKTSRAHLGVDYSASIGTPIRAVGDGTVMMAGWSGGGGKVIKLRHNSSYQTAYKHLSGFAKGVHSGARVKQGQVIGYTGNTGLSTGPHLHFEFWSGGRYVDPLRKKFPSADPVPTAQLEQFKAESAVFLATLPAWENRDISTADISSDVTVEKESKK